MVDTVTIRPYRAGDAPHLSALYRRSVEAIGPRHYSPEQVAAWATLTPSAERVHAMATDGRTTLVAVDAADLPVAWGDVEADGHIGVLYCAPEAAGVGVGSAVYDALEAVARAAGVARLHSEASEAAVRLFERKGFTVLARRRLVVAGVAIHNHAVEKALEPQPA